MEYILAAAAQIFETHGYAAGTTNRIAERAGVSIGTLYQYFPSKEAVAVALLERHIDDTLNKLHDWVEHMVSEHHGLRSALCDYVHGMLEMHCSHPRLQHILLEETPIPERVHQLLLEAEKQLAKIMAGFLELYSVIHYTKLDYSGFLVVQTVESLTHRFAAHPSEQLMSKDIFTNELVLMLEAYLTREMAE